jgi:hypothetical protein
MQLKQKPGVKHQNFIRQDTHTKAAPRGDDDDEEVVLTRFNNKNTQE